MMRAKEKIERLRAEIEKQLIPLIDSDPKNSAPSTKACASPLGFSCIL